MAAGLVERMMTFWVRLWLRWSWARRIAKTNAPRSASNTVAVMLTFTLCGLFRCLGGRLLLCRRRVASLSWLALEPQEKTVRWSGVLVLVWMVFTHIFRSSPCLIRWLEVKRGEVRSSAQEGAAKASM
jgi:hypothetical protein